MPAITKATTRFEIGHQDMGDPARHLGRRGGVHAAVPSCSPAIIRPSLRSSASAWVSSPTMPPSNMTMMRSARRHDFVEFDRDQKDGLALVAHRDEAFVDELDGADVDAAGGLADEQQVWVLIHFAHQHDLLLVAAAERGGAQRADWTGAHRSDPSFRATSSTMAFWRIRTLPVYLGRGDGRGWNFRWPGTTPRGPCAGGLRARDPDPFAAFRGRRACGWHRSRCL